MDNNTQPKSVFWPVDLIPKDCPNARVLMFGYDSKITKYRAGATNRNGIFSHGKDLLFALSRERHRDCPLVFVAHSLGGIIVKQASQSRLSSAHSCTKLSVQMLAESLSLPETPFVNIVKSTAAVIFLGTPHRGSQDVAALGEVMRSVVSALGMETSPVNLHALGLKTSDLERAQEDFSKLWQKYDFHVKTFQEGLSFTKIGKKVVPDYSSLIGDHREHAETLQADHLEMCRYSGSDDPNYHKVAGELHSIYHTITRGTNVDASPSRRIRHPSGSLSDSSSKRLAYVAGSSYLNYACLATLWFPAIYSRFQNVESPAHSTCSWLFMHPEYEKWFNSKSRSRCYGLLWLKGKPGAGKSTLMKEAFRRAATRQARANYCTAGFFFCANGNELEHTSLGLFRSLLYQLLPGDRLSLQRFQQYCNEKKNPLKSQSTPAESITWTETELRQFMKSVLLNQTKRTIIFIDALDECDGASIRSLAYFWRSITKSAHDLGLELNVCLSSRHFPTISLSHCAEIVVEEHNGDDIASYVDQKFRICMSAQKPQWELLRRQILKKAAGIFLWAVLVAEDVLKNWDNGKELPYLIRRVRDVPEALENLFSNLLSDLEPSTRQLTVRFFQWVILATKPLRLHEWHHIMAFIRQPASPERLPRSTGLTSSYRRLAKYNSRPAFRSLSEWRESAHFTESDEQLEKQIRSLSRGLVEVKKVWTSEPQEGDIDVISTYAGAGSLNFEHGDTRIVQVIHESVRDFFLGGNGFSVLDSSLRHHPIGNGHLTIMATCLDYVHISELDALVKARILAAGRRGRRKHLKKTSSSDAHSQHSIVGERPSVKGSQKVSIFDTLAFSNPASGIDIVQKWLTNDGDTPVRWSHPEELQCESDTASSDGSPARMLEDYPALLSYATSNMFIHAQLAEKDGIDQTPLIKRFEDEATWTRWLALREDIPDGTPMRSYAMRMGLRSWSNYYVRDGVLPPSTSEQAEDDDSSSDRSGSVASFSSASSHAAFNVRRRSSRSRTRRQRSNYSSELLV
ncbi:Protein SERAC1 [Trichoderma ghanense]|uniref:Protein SERAC1 n=1 Tax=Trichoderma ghanense TaxID=65468 RepID=A0ABY2GTH3_9HYPO